MGNLRKKRNQAEILEIKSAFSQTKNTVEGHSSRLEKWKTESQNSKIKYILKKNRRTLGQATQEL
jgi:hypothetical protein